jgi:hypothetical protein
MMEYFTPAPAIHCGPSGFNTSARGYEMARPERLELPTCTLPELGFPHGKVCVKVDDSGLLRGENFDFRAAITNPDLARDYRK